MVLPNEKEKPFVDGIMSLAWPYLMFFTLIFSEVITLISTFLVNPQDFDLLIYFSEGLGASVFSLFLIPVVLVSLKWKKSYLFLFVFSFLVYIVQVYFWIYAIQSADMTGYIGSTPIYQKGIITIQGWISILFSPFLFASIFGLFMFLKRRF